jgi:outer membrane protein TolC
MVMKKILLVTIVILSPFICISGQNPVLEEYIAGGLESNHALRQRQLDYSISLAALKEARGLFFPEISANARYTVADGGRVIEFPVGDLLNPVYNTLNMLTSSQNFPQIENEEFNFYRAKEHETKLSLVQPIFKSDIIHNARIRKAYLELSAIDIKQYKRELVKEIKTAYYTYQQSDALRNLADSTMVLVEENLRVNRSLYNNDLRTIDAVYRAEAEVSKVAVERARAMQQLSASRAYFNFLLNRPLDSDITLHQEEPKVFLFSLDEGQAQAVSSREELSMIKQYRSVNEHLLRLHKGAGLPDLFAAVDYGFQGGEYTFTGDDDFVLASVVFRWTLFQGLTNRNKIAQTRLEGEKLASVLQETEMKIRMEVMNNYYAVLASHEAVTAANKQLLSAKSAFRLIDRKYREDRASLLEYIDARTNYTNARSNLIISTNAYFIRLAEFEYATAGEDINQY